MLHFKSFLNGGAFINQNETKVNNIDLNEIIREKSLFYKLDEGLVRSIIKTESSWNTYAIRYEDGYNYLYEPDKFARAQNITVQTEVILQKCSYGLMQIMGAVMREHGFLGSLLTVCNPSINIEFGCKHLSGFVKKYPKIEHAIASYNAGSPSFDKNGQLVNQIYVDKVMGAWRALQTSNRIS